MTGRDGSAEPLEGTADWWDARYIGGDIPWDTGEAPPELVALLQSAEGGGGWALDLGCGTGLNTRYLAYRGFTAIGVDLARSALERAAQTAREEGVSAYFCLGDVSELSFLAIRAVLAVDIGCFHAIPPEVRAAYVESLADHLVSGAHFLLYAHAGEPDTGHGPHGVDAKSVAYFATRFDLLRVEHGEDRGRRAAWYLMRRR